MQARKAIVIRVGPVVLKMLDDLQTDKPHLSMNAIVNDILLERAVAAGAKR